MNEQSQQRPEDDEIEIDLRGLLQVAYKRRWTIFSTLVIIVLAVAVRDFTATPLYSASTRLIIEKENPKVTSIQEVLTVDASGTDYYQTQYKIIESRTVARKVIERLNLSESEEFFPKPSDSAIAKFRRSVRETIGAWKKSLVSLLKSKDDKNDAASEGQDDSGLVSSFISRIEVTPIRNSRLLDISFEARDPVMATKIVNALAQSYMAHNLEVRLQAVQDAMEWMNDRIAKERDRVETAERNLQNYRELHGIITEFSGDVETVTAQKLAKLNEEVVRAESTRVVAETKYSQALRLKDNPLISASIPEVLKNPLIQQIKQSEVELFGRISELSKKYGDQHPSMKAAQSELDSLEKRRSAEVLRIIESLKNEYEVAKAQEQSLAAALEKQKHDALELNKKAIEFGVLKRETESAREMYEILIKRFKETSVTEDLNASNISIVDPAEVPRGPSKPRIKRDLLLAMVVGLMLGIFLAFFIEYLDNTIKTPEEIEQYLHIPFLGMIPRFDFAAKNGSSSESAVFSNELVAERESKSTASEAYRNVRTKVYFSTADVTPRIIVVTSSTAQEGKTITSANLAVTMAQAGSRVLLVDCDMRRPRLHRLFKAARDKGIANILVGDSRFDEVVVETGIANLDLIACGPIPPNPSELLGAEQMRHILKDFASNYDQIVIDSPPISAVTDAAILSRQADGVVVVLRANATGREQVKNALAQLQAVNAKIFGVVLNDVDMERNAYYYKYYYSGYYEQEEKKGRKQLRSAKKKTTAKQA